MNRYRFTIIAGLVVLFTALHYMTPFTVPSLHIVYRELYFVPVILAGLWRNKGGLITSIAVSLIYIPHVFFLAEPHPSFDPDRLFHHVHRLLCLFRSPTHGVGLNLELVA